jgi:hypothetical protein
MLKEPVWFHWPVKICDDSMGERRVCPFLDDLLSFVFEDKSS